MHKEQTAFQDEDGERSYCEDGLKKSSHSLKRQPFGDETNEATVTNKSYDDDCESESEIAGHSKSVDSEFDSWLFDVGWKHVVQLGERNLVVTSTLKQSQVPKRLYNNKNRKAAAQKRLASKKKSLKTKRSDIVMFLFP